MPLGVAQSARAHQATRLATAALSGVDLDRVDALVRSVTTELHADSASLSLMAERQITLSACGLEQLEIARGDSFAFDDTICANALRHEGPLVIDDCHADARVSSVPSVSSGLVGAYLGAPLAQDGQVVGVVCAMCQQRRTWLDADVARLQRIADELVRTLSAFAAA